MRYQNGYLTLSKTDKKHFINALRELKLNLGATGDKKTDSENANAYQFMLNLANHLEVHSDE
jgi:hypothetical protein